MDIGLIIAKDEVVGSKPIARSNLCSADPPLHASAPRAPTNSSRNRSARGSLVNRGCPMQTKRVPAQVDRTAPDGSEIRFLLRMSRGQLNHFTLAPRATSTAVTHKTIEEIWYFLSGMGLFWHKEGDLEEIVDVGAGVCLDIPTGTHFQFRSTSDEPLCFVIATMPPWSGDDEAVTVEGPWQPAP